VIDGVIQATAEDYEHVRPMVNEFLGRVQGDAATPSMMRLLTIIHERMSADVRDGNGYLIISQPELAKELGITQQAISYQLTMLIEKGYLINGQQTPKKPAKLKLGAEFNLQTITQQALILLSAEALEL
jgi:biotin operon repressor